MQSNVINASRMPQKGAEISAATIHSTETRKKLLEFEALVAPSERASKFQRKGQPNMQIIDDDPVVYWTDYIEFVSLTYPDDEKSIYQLRTRATRALIHIPKYSNDVRFLRICILAADSSPQPLQDFQALYDLGIGIKMACFWMVWAFKAETLKDYHTATAVYIMALKYEAVPIKVVRQRYLSYKVRMKNQGICYDPRQRKREASSIISYDNRESSTLDCSCSEQSSDSSEFSKRRRRVTMSPKSKPLLDISNHAEYTNTSTRHFNRSQDEMSYEMVRSKKMYYNTLTTKNNFNLLAKSDVVDEQCIYYNEIHVANVEQAKKDFSSKRLAHQNEALPLVLLKPPQKSKSKPKKVRLNDVEYIVKRLLGKGHYGTVVLLESDCSNKIALKIQQPVSCLCWEYHILRQISNRLSSKSMNLSFFPRPLSFTKFQDGATLALSVGSEAGLTLLDIVNVYKGSVPEILVIHYTHQLFRILQLLHIHCNILHCDIKPDQIVICHQDNEYRSQLMLVDFGRAIDLKDAAKNFGKTEFKGNISVEGMQCISMRNKLEWSYDIDLFGVIMSAFTLLFGEYVDVKRGTDLSWSLSKPFKRYWNNDLWYLLLDTISITSFNFDDYVTLLDSIETAFRSYIDERKRDLEVIQRDLMRLLTRYSHQM